MPSSSLSATGISMQRNPVKMSRFGPKMGRRRTITGAITASTSAPEVSGPFWDWKKAAGKSVYQESARPKTENGNSFVTSSRIVNQHCDNSWSRRTNGMNCLTFTFERATQFRFLLKLRRSWLALVLLNHDLRSNHDDSPPSQHPRRRYDPCSGDG